MRRILLYITSIAIGVGVANAAVRDATSVSRSATTEPTKKVTYTAPEKKRVTTSRTSDNGRNNARSTTTARSAKNTVTTGTARSATSVPYQARSATNISTTTAARSATKSRGATARSATNTANIASTIARAALSTNASSVLGTGYTACRDAYFTCMDQFCANNDDTYRRCICSSRLSDIQTRESALAQASTQLQDFKDLNLSVIDKTSAEVGAMLSATAGETAQANAKDTSDSAMQLAGISDVLSKTKTNSLSNQGTLDIAGDISAIWDTTDLTGGNNIANLTGEALYNAVHAQCTEMVKDICPSDATRTMVVSAYGMYIENDCSLLQNNLDKKLTSANTDIRTTEHDMNLARLNNYDVHNSLDINDCIARVRQDITADVACGTDYVHCLDITGKYLNYTTGEPIYSAEFFQLENMLSLSGDTLKNPTNRMTITKLNNMRHFATTSLDTCRDVSDIVWDEFLRQAIAEIYQGQHDRIRTVKDECLDVVNTCYDEQNQSLKDFSNNADETTYGMRLELAEQMCQEKMDACSNLYGGGATGMTTLVNTMHKITNEKIAQQCLDALQAFAKKQCHVASNDTQHAYPYSCRTYAPGEHKYMNKKIDNDRTCQDLTNIAYSQKPEIILSQPSKPGPSTPAKYSCQYQKRYTSCKPKYYLAKVASEYAAPAPQNNVYEAYFQYTTDGDATMCRKCPSGYTCAGEDNAPDLIKTSTDYTEDCADYPGSLYQLMVKYAKQMCVRPSEATNAGLILPENIVQDVNKIMDQIKIDMSKQLSDECERRAGIWVDLPWQDTEQDGFHDITGDILNATFYTNTAANTKWGYCKTPPVEDAAPVIKYTIKYEKGGYSSTTVTGTMNNTTCEYNKACTLQKNQFKANGHGFSVYFKGWKDTSSGETYDDMATVINLTNINGKTITLTAQWGT